MPENDEPKPDPKVAAANAREAEANARKAEFEAEQAKWSALIPDLKSGDASTLQLPADKLVAAPLAFAAMENAAAIVAKRFGQQILGQEKDGRVILVTEDIDLATSGMAYLEVEAAIETLDARAKAVLEPPAQEGRISLAPAALGAISAVAGAIPGLLSLLSAKRSVVTADIGANNLAAAAAVIAALRSTKGTSASFVHRDFRVVPRGEVPKRLSTLYASRARLYQKKIELGEAEETKAQLAEVEAVIAAIDEFSASLRARPSDGGSSLLAMAMLYEQLYVKNTSNNTAYFTHVLLVRSEGGQTQQAVNDRPFWLQDKVTVIAEVAITFMLVEISSSAIVASGSVSGIAQAHGNVGQRLQTQ